MSEDVSENTFFQQSFLPVSMIIVDPDLYFVNTVLPHF